MYSSRKKKKLRITYNTDRSDTIQRYIDCFISFTSFYHVLPVDKKVIAKLGLISNQFKDKSTSRDLPKPSEILNFKDCIETFYEDSIKIGRASCMKRIVLNSGSCERDREAEE